MPDLAFAPLRRPCSPQRSGHHKATVEGDPLMTAGITLLDVSAERGRAATLDRAHDTALTAAEFISVLPTVD